METKERPHREAIKTLKSKIKDLAALQVKNKLARKTVRIDPEVRKKLLEELGIKYPEWAHAEVMARKNVITAHLNLYHELRGKAYRHNVPTYSFDKDRYEETLRKLREEFKLS